MGVLIQPLYKQKLKQQVVPAVSPGMERLFTEFLVRYKEWHSSRKCELRWLTATMLLGVASLTYWMYPIYAWNVNLILFLSFIGVLRHYLIVRQLANHLYINVHILHHHLLGKLDVGFCDHQGPCQCSEQFKRYVWDHYRISLYGDRL
ncbi:hypothetical protein [Desulfitobacterium sp.]|uniref:hypothetical protein n=1 Tax=Desulfitobacterium sp. TaxID=49981 RepID=UPI002C7E13A2|nr:hypothetical protein [Desulfitobacterium sp.]HVJ50292.1 hypothetical protein [Desulfitobacterium sp.]